MGGIFWGGIGWPGGWLVGGGGVEIRLSPARHPSYASVY